MIFRIFLTKMKRRYHMAMINIADRIGNSGDEMLCKHYDAVIRCERILTNR